MTPATNQGDLSEGCEHPWQGQAQRGRLPPLLRSAPGKVSLLWLLAPPQRHPQMFPRCFLTLDIVRSVDARQWRASGTCSPENFAVSNCPFLPLSQLPSSLLGFPKAFRRKEPSGPVTTTGVLNCFCTYLQPLGTLHIHPQSLCARQGTGRAAGSTPAAMVCSSRKQPAPLPWVSTHLCLMSGRSGWGRKVSTYPAEPCQQSPWAFLSYPAAQEAEHANSRTTCYRGTVCQPGNEIK